MCCSDRHGEDSDDTEESFSTQLHRYKTIFLSFPMCGSGGLEARAVILHYDAGYRILKRFVKFGQVLDARLNDLLTPLVNFVFLIRNA